MGGRNYGRPRYRSLYGGGTSGLGAPWHYSQAGDAPAAPPADLPSPFAGKTGSRKSYPFGKGVRKTKRGGKKRKASKKGKKCGPKKGLYVCPMTRTGKPVLSKCRRVQPHKKK